MIDDKDYEKPCKYKNCQEIRFIVTINNDYWYQIVTKYLDLNITLIKELLITLYTIKINKKPFLLCQKHLLEKYQFLFEIDNPNITDQEIINIFELKINEWHCSALYSSLFSTFDNLRNSLLKLLNSKKDDEFANPLDFFNPEFRWFIEENHYLGIPVYWKKNYKLENT